MIFAQLTNRESLRGIGACLMGRRALAYRMGICGGVTRTNFAYAVSGEWQVFAEIAGVPMQRAQRLYGDTPPELGLDAVLFALDATVIELSRGSPGPRRSNIPDTRESRRAGLAGGMVFIFPLPVGAMPIFSRRLIVPIRFLSRIFAKSALASASNCSLGASGRRFA